MRVTGAVRKGFLERGRINWMRCELIECEVLAIAQMAKLAGCDFWNECSEFITAKYSS